MFYCFYSIILLLCSSFFLQNLAAEKTYKQSVTLVTGDANCGVAGSKTLPNKKAIVYTNPDRSKWRRHDLKNGQKEKTQHVVKMFKTSAEVNNRRTIQTITP